MKHRRCLHLAFESLFPVWKVLTFERKNLKFFFWNGISKLISNVKGALEWEPVNSVGQSVVLGWRRRSSAMRRKCWNGSCRKRPEHATRRRRWYKTSGVARYPAWDQRRRSTGPSSEPFRQNTCRSIPQCTRSVNVVRPIFGRLPEPNRAWLLVVYFFTLDQSAFGIFITWLPCLHTKHLPVRFW